MARVLLADSQPLFSEALEALFSRDDARRVIGRCSTAEDALTHVTSLQPGLVLVDAALGLDGWTNLVQRTVEACPAARVVVLGDDHDADLLLAALRAGAAGVVGKTYGASTVLRVAGAVLDGEGAVPGACCSRLEAATFAMQRSAELEAAPAAPGGPLTGTAHRRHGARTVTISEQTSAGPRRLPHGGQLVDRRPDADEAAALASSPPPSPPLTAAEAADPADAVPRR